jgi:adenylate cyclase
MNPVSKLFQSPLVTSLFVGTVVFLGIVGLRSTGSLESLELTAYDWYIRLQPEVSELDSRIVLIEINENDIQNQVGWPLIDATVAKVLEILISYQPRAIGLDLYRDISVPPGSKKLEAILTKNHNIITAMKFGGAEKVGIPPPPALKDTDQVGFNDIIVDPGGIVRRGLLFLDDAKNVFYSFAFRLSLLYLRAEGVTPQPDSVNPEHLRLGPTTIPPFGPNDGGYIGADAQGYQFLLSFRKSKNPFSAFSLSTLLSLEINPEAIKDKIVLIGTKTEGVKDFFYTPFSRGLHSDQQISGVELHACIINELLAFALQGSLPMRTLRDWQEWFWILLWSVMGGAMYVGVRSPWHFSLLTLCGLFILPLTTYFSFLHGWWIPLVPPAIAWFVSATVVTAYISNKERLERAFLMQLFSKHVSREVAEVIWKERNQFLDGGRPRSQKLISTVMFTDLEGFTALSEKMDPQALIDWLNTYHEAMSQLVMKHGGIVDEYAGDGLKADFGVPVPRTTEPEISQDAVNAVNCALAMKREINRLNTIWHERNLPTVNMRVGIFTGPVVAGSLGSTQRLKYTTIGDTVNIASRLEGLSKDLVGYDFKNSPCRILIGESTLRYLGNQFRTKRVGEVSLKGRAEKIDAHCLIGRVEGNSSDTDQEGRV